MIRAHPTLRSIQNAAATSGAHAVWAGHMGAGGAQLWRGSEEFPAAPCSNPARGVAHIGGLLS